MNNMFFSESVGEVLLKLKSNKNGLSENDAFSRLKKNGENIIVSKKKTSKFLLFFSQFADIMIVILLLASFVSMGIAIYQQTINELIDGFIILGIVILNAVIGFVQEIKAENSMEALKKMTEPESKVLRNGAVKKILSKNLVLGDIVLVEAGDIVPADCRLIESTALKCEESSLTGESVPVEKDSKLLFPQNTGLAERKNMIYFGSVVSAGYGIAVVVATGPNTEIGKIANIISNTQKEETPLQKGIKNLGQILTFVILGICCITFFIELFFGNSSPLDAFLTSVALAVAAIPESLPAVITIIMSLGVAKLAKRKAIVKHLHAVETLGSCSVICSDKTGTLTQNKMSVKSLFYNNNLYDEKNIKNNKEFTELLNAMVLCNNSKKNEKKYIGDSTETALCYFADNYLFEKEKIEKKYEKISEIPFDSTRKLMSSVYLYQNEKVVYTKGAIDEILKICKYISINGNIIELSQIEKQKILNANKKMAEKALRVLGFAYKKCFNNSIESDLVFVGLVGMIDPPRKEVKSAISKCKSAGIAPIMITGDHKDTAFAIAKEIGLATSEKEILTGNELDILSDENFLKILPNIKVFARVSPENKVRIVETLKKQGKIVAMTGDGVNDAPSIKKANIGIGMGINGTEVTKEVADVIIADDNFATIIVAVEEGRKIYANIQKTIQFLFSANLAEILSIFFVTLFFPSLLFLSPVQILFVNLISDTLPAIALGLEPAEKNIMQKNPRKNNSNIFSGGMWQSLLIMGVLQAFAMILCFFFGKFIFGSDIIATTLAFYALNIIQFFYFISIRANGNAFKNSIFKNKWAVVSVLTCFAFVGIIALTPIREFLCLAELNMFQWCVIFGLGIVIFFLSELIKKINWKKIKNN